MHIDHLQLPELEALRARIGLSQAALCRSANLSTSTYVRWMRYIRGQPRGTCPQPEKLRAVRDALKRAQGADTVGGVAAHSARPSAAA